MTRTLALALTAASVLAIAPQPASGLCVNTGVEDRWPVPRKICVPVFCDEHCDAELILPGGS